MKKLLFLPLFLFLAAAGTFGWFYLNAQPASQNSDPKNFLITKGSSASQIGTKLESVGLIRSALAFKIYTQISGISGRIATGEFRLSPGLNLFQIIDQLLKGPTELWVTIPEGLRREEVAEKFAKGLEKNSSFVSEFLAYSKFSEGKLFPDLLLQMLCRAGQPLQHMAQW